MEKIPAASAMGWSIELEKGLRSKKPGKCAEEILKIGSRLEQWSRESKVTVAEYKIFGLIPGEDKLFLNAIVLRLADSFRLGDKGIKRCIVKIFVQELKYRRKRMMRSGNSKGSESIFSKNMLSNSLEILRKVKVVFDNGDVEERALALALFGCWADFAKDSPDIRYVLLSSLVSDHILEVKASLFAAGCFCELADDFAYILLEIMLNMLTFFESSKSFEFRLGVGRAFARMSGSFPIATRAYEVGLKLLLDSSEENFSRVMLISLTKIASKWTMLIPRQIDSLLSFLTNDKAFQIQVMALRCLDYILERGVSSYAATTERICNLLNILHKSKFSPALLYKALKVLHNILLCNLPNFPTSEISDVFSAVLAYTEKMILYSVMSKRLVAFRALVDFSENILLRAKDSSLLSRVISLIMHRISLLVNSKVDAKQTDTEMEQEVTSLLNLILNLVQRHSDVSGLLLDKFCVFMGYLVNMFDKHISENHEDMTDQESLKFERENMTKLMLKFSLPITEIMMICLGKLEAVDAVANQALNALMTLVENVHMSISFNHSYTLRIYFLLLQSDSVYRCLWRVMRQVVEFDITTSPFCADSFCDHENFSLKCAKEIIQGEDYWCSYKAGKFAACQGSWSTSAFIFEQLICKVHTDSCSWWLKSLSLLSRAESQIQLLGHTLSKGSLSGEVTTWKINSCTYTEILMGLHKTLHVAKEILSNSFTGVPFSFQRWFLDLRINVLETVLDLTRFLSIFSSRKQSSNFEHQKSTCSISNQMSFQELKMSLQESNDMVYSFREFSYRLKKIALQFDMLAISAFGIDRQSMMIISALAMSCSLLAFSTTFALSIPSSASEQFQNSGLDRSQGQLYIAVIQDLLGRVWHIDSESRQSLLRLLKVYQNSDSCFSLESQSQPADFSCEGSVISKLCRYAVLGIVGLQNDSSRFHSAESLSQTYRFGLELLLDIISKWMRIPLRCPKYFFQLRPCVSSELIVMNEDGEKIDGKSISSGNHLLLNLCLQLKDIPAYMPVQLSKLYCILHCKMQPSNSDMKEQSSLNSNNGQNDEIVDLNEKLLQYVSGSAKSTGIDVENSSGSCWAQDKYICFHPNGRYQGFSTCLLDISAFPAGVYQIKWHSGCVDRQGSYWSLLPQNAGPVFNIRK